MMQIRYCVVNNYEMNVKLPLSDEYKNRLGSG